MENGYSAALTGYSRGHSRVLEGYSRVLEGVLTGTRANQPTCASRCTTENGVYASLGFGARAVARTGWTPKRRAESRSRSTSAFATPRRPAHRHVSTGARGREGGDAVNHRGSVRARATARARVCAGRYGCARGGVGDTPAEVVGLVHGERQSLLALSSGGPACMRLRVRSMGGGAGL
jgi:hypothetical protein